MRGRILTRICAVLLSLSAGFPALQASQGLTPEMVVGLKRAGAAVLSPSGRLIAYTLAVPRSAGEKPGRPYSELWLVPAAGGEARPLTFSPGSVASPQWSPDGRTITFLSRREEQDEKAQVYALAVDGGEARPLTRHPTPVSSYAWSPDGRWIAFVATDPETEEEKKAREQGRDAEVPDHDYKHRRLWVVSHAGGEARKVFDRDLNVWSFVWRPDSGGLVLQSTETPRIDDSYMNRAIHTVALHGDEPRLLLQTPGKLGPMSVSPEGGKLAYLGAVSRNDPLAQSLFVTSLTGGEARNLTGGWEGSALDLNWADGDSITLLGAEGTQTALYLVHVETGERKRLGETGVIVQSLDGHFGSRLMAAVATAPDVPGDVYSLSREGKATRLTDHNPQLSEVRLARQESIEWGAGDGLRITGVLTYPLEYREGRRYPLVLQIHGGPEGISFDGWTTRASTPVQVLAARGYFVLEPNYRGSQGRGVAFSKADHDDLGGREFQDVLDGVDALVERGLVDAGRVGTGGWSYGGYFSAWAATRFSERFRAAFVGAGIANWISFTGSTDIPYEMSLVHWDSWWFDDPELHWKRSPLAYLNQARTPTLIVHGKRDERVHPEQGLELYTALRIKRIPARLVLYPREPHGLLEREHQLDFIERVIEWFDRYLGESPTDE